MTTALTMVGARRRVWSKSKSAALLNYSLVLFWTGDQTGVITMTLLDAAPRLDILLQISSVDRPCAKSFNFLLNSPPFAVCGGHIN